MMSSAFRPEFFKLDYGDIKKNHIAVMITPGLDVSEPQYERVRDLTIEHVKTHLFFYLNGDLEKLLFFEKNISIEQLRSRGIDFLICVPFGFFIPDENTANELMVNISSSGLCIDRTKPFVIDLAGHTIGEFSQLMKQALNPQAPEVSESDLNIACQLAEQQLKAHYQKAFRSIFLFNTEGYQDIEVGDTDEEVIAVGFASGFKLNYLAEKLRRRLRRLLFVDSNASAIEFKKEMFATWDGNGFVDWFLQRHFDDHQYFYEQSVELIRDLWQRELDRWGGPVTFRKHWEWFQNQDVSFKNFDLITECHRLTEWLPDEGKVVFWNSNMWHNEFIYKGKTTAMVFKDYQTWLTKLNQRNPCIRLIQADVLGPKGWVQPSGRSVIEVLQECKEQNGTAL